MNGFFWLLFGVNAVFAGLVTLALPHGQNFVYALMAGSQLGMLVMLARSRREGDEPLSPPPPGHPVWRNPRVPR